MHNYEYIEDGSQMILFNYTTIHLAKKDKVRFYYALKGRDGKTGIVKQFKLIHLGKGVILAPSKFDEDMGQFFRIWQISYSKRRVIVGKEEVIGKLS